MSDSDQYTEVEPYQQTTLDGRPPLSVYHQGDEEQTAVWHTDGWLELRGPNHWFVTVDHGLDLAAIDTQLAQLKAGWAQAGAPQDPKLLAVIRAAEQMRAVFGPATTG